MQCREPIKFRRTIASLALLFAVTALDADTAPAQEINFDQINKFESSGNLHVGAPAKTIIDDSERHVVILTIWDADAETKVYWRSPDGNDAARRSYPGKASRLFKPPESSNLKPSVSQNREVNYGYVLLGLGTH
jgi:hypothetical protein